MSPGTWIQSLKGPAGTCLSGVGCGAAGFGFAEALAVCGRCRAARLGWVINFAAGFAGKSSNANMESCVFV